MSFKLINSLTFCNVDLKPIYIIKFINSGLTILIYLNKEKTTHGIDNTSSATTVDATTEREEKSTLFATSQIIPEPTCRTKSLNNLFNTI